MIPSSRPIRQPAFHSARSLPHTFVLLTALLLTGLSACRSDKSVGRQTRIRLTVGEIREVSLPGRGDSTVQLIGSSDNQEVVDVSRRQLAPAVDTLQTGSGPTVFQIKGITVGTANVIFSEKRTGETGSGQARKTYVVQVTSK